MTRVSGMQMFTQREAAEACGISIETIKRRRTAGAFPGAEADDRGVWRIPLADLLAAGLNPGRPAPPEETTAAPAAQPEDVIDLREQIADLRGRLAERDRADARAAELVEQLQAALRGQMLAIEAGRADADGRIAALEQARAAADAAVEQARADVEAAQQQARAAGEAQARAVQQALDRAVAEQAAARRWAAALLLVLAASAAGLAAAILLTR